MNIQTDKTIFSVSQLNRRVKQLLETQLPLIWVSGEISNLTQHGSGHWYFTLKDDRAQVKCAMFKAYNRHLRWQPCAGKQIVLRARVSLYENRGDFQLIVEHMEEAGDGALQQTYEKLKRKLQQEGLFDSGLKKSLPYFPRHIGVISSPSGAAIHDIISVIKRRYWIAPVTIIPVTVQGKLAAGEIIQALQKAEVCQLFDVIILGRGGGSLEDLWAFNDEELARKIAACRIPIVSAIGHEVDFTIADFVADARAPTPSASAEMVTPDLNEWRQTLDSFYNRLSINFQQTVAYQKKRLHHLYKRLRHPKDHIQLQQQHLQRLQQSLKKTMVYNIKIKQQALAKQQQRLQWQHPQKLLESLRQSVTDQQLRAAKATATSMQKHRQSLATLCQLLEAVSPLRTLQRGYAIVTDENQHIVHSSSRLSTGDVIHTRLSSGSVTSEVKKLVHSE